jgi:hypothetical protein
MSAELKSKSDVSIVLFFFTALAVFGLAGGGFVVHDYARSRASHAWPAAEGIVLSRLDAERAHVRYVYSVGGHSFESTRERSFMGRFALGENGDFRPGESVTVFFNPEDPSYSVLYPGGSGGAFVALSVLAGLSIFFGLGGLVWTLSRTRAFSGHAGAGAGVSWSEARLH